MIDSKIGTYATKWMCSNQCPCDEVSVAPWLALSETALVAKGRTKNLKDTNDADGTVLLLATKPTLKTTDFFPETFLECYLEWKNDWETSGAKTGVAPALW
jgi:hypothetical protein